LFKIKQLILSLISIALKQVKEMLLIALFQN
jgi:hypothetical protein